MARMVFLILTLMASAMKLDARNITLRAFLNTNNCFSCEGSLRELKELNAGIVLEIHVNESEKEILTDYLNKFGLRDLNYTVKTHQKIKFDPKHHSTSFYQILFDGRLIASFYGEYLEAYIRGLNTFNKTAAPDLSIPISRPVRFSKAASVSIDSTLVNINDFNLGKNMTYAIHLREKHALPVDSHYVSEVIYSDYFGLGQMDTVLYNLDREFVMKRGTTATLEQALLRRHSLYILLSLPNYQWIDSLKLLRSSSTLFFLEKDLLSGISKTYYVKDSWLSSPDSTRYFIDNSKSLFVDHGAIYLPLFASSYAGSSANKFVLMRKDADTLKYDRFAAFRIDGELNKKHKLDDDITFTNSRVSYHVKNKLIYDFEHKKVVTDLLNNSKGGEVLDVRVDGAFVRFLMIKRNKVSLITFDRITKKKIDSFAIRCDEDFLSSSGRLFNSDYILLMTKAGDKFLLKGY